MVKIGFKCFNNILYNRSLIWIFIFLLNNKWQFLALQICFHFASLVCTYNFTIYNLDCEKFLSAYSELEFDDDMVLSKVFMS